MTNKDINLGKSEETLFECDPTPRISPKATVIFVLIIIGLISFLLLFIEMKTFQMNMTMIFWLIIILHIMAICLFLYQFIPVINKRMKLANSSYIISSTKIIQVIGRSLLSRKLRKKEMPFIDIGHFRMVSFERMEIVEKSEDIRFQYDGTEKKYKYPSKKAHKIIFESKSCYFNAYSDDMEKFKTLLMRRLPAREHPKIKDLYITF